MIGTTINDRYRIEKELGRGGVGTVYKGYDLVLERDVAIKMVTGSDLGTDGRIRLTQEAKAVAQLSHPNIVTVHDVGEYQQSPFIVMELVQGQNLYQQPPEGLAETLTIMQQVCAALAHAHSQGIIHRDIKPENVLLDENGTAKLMDFGIARSAASRLTEEGTLVGTVFYISPEQALGKQIDHRADLYSLGVMLYELVCGRLPFEAEDPLAVITQHLHAPVVPPVHLNPKIPETLSALIMQLLAKNPEARVDSAEAVREQLLAVINEIDSPTTTQAVSSFPKESKSVRLDLLDRIVRGRLIGREAELAELRGFWDRAVQREGHMVLLSGEPGVGKSRLARELEVFARFNGALVLMGSFQAEMDVPYIALLDVIREILRTHDPQTLKTILPPYAPELVKLVPDVCDFVDEFTPNPVLGNLQEERLRQFDHLTRFFLELAADRPLLIILEDLHWADIPSLDYLHHLLRNNTRAKLLVVGTYREVDLDPARPFYEKLVGLNRERLYTRIALRRLDKETTCRLVSTLLGGEVEGVLAEQIVFETDGNPFYVEEVVKSLVSRNAITEIDGVWVPVPDANIQVPQSLQIAIGKRVFSLPEDAQETLRLAAVSGHDFNFDVLLELTGWEEDHLLDILDTAEEAQLIHEIKGDPLHDYAFEHALIAQVLYEDISQRRRARYHERTARSIEKVFAHRLEPVVEALTYHYGLAPTRSAEKVVQYGLQAAEKAAGSYAHEQAAQHYQAVLEAYEDLDDPIGKASAWETLGDILNKLGEVSRSLEAYEFSVQTLKNAGQVETLAYCQVAFKLADGLSTVQGAHSRLILQELLTNPALSTSNPLRSIIMSEWALYKLSEGEFDEALTLGEQALALAETSRDQVAIGLALTKLGLIHRARQETEGYEQAMQQLIDILQEVEDYSGLFDTFYDGINYHFLKGNMGKASQLAESGLSFCERSNTPGWQGTILAMYLFILGAQGRFREALELGDGMLPLNQKVGVSGCFLLARTYLVMVNSRMGNIEQAEVHVTSLLNLRLQFEGASSDSDSYLVWKFLSDSYMGHWEEAWRLLQGFVEHEFYPHPNTHAAYLLLNCFGPEVAARNGNFSFAEERARALIEDARSSQLTPLFVWGLFDLGLALAGLGKNIEALDSFQEALSLFREFQWPWETGQTMQEMARVLIERDEPGDRDQAQAYLQEAYQIFDSISAQPMRDQTEELLALVETA